MEASGNCNSRCAKQQSKPLKIQQYRAIGTVEECRELKIRNTPKKREIINGGITVCPECNAKVKRCYSFCPYCGQAIDWSENDEKQEE